MDWKPPPRIDLRQLHAFRVLAKELHFGRAAEKLSISQPPLSQQIKRLEAAIGCALFVRDTRHVQLTPAGVALAEIADTVLAQLHAGLEAVRAVAGGSAGRLAIGFTSTTALRCLPLLVSAFRARFAQIELELIELWPDAMRVALLTGEIDVALLRDPAPWPGLVVMPVAEERFVAVLPSGHRLAEAGTAFRLRDLSGDPFVLFPRDHASQGLAKMLDLCAQAGFTPRIVQEVPGWQTAISMVGSGLGVSILPESVVSLQLPGISYRPIDSTMRSSACLLFREDEDRPMVRNFIETSTTVMIE